MTKIKRKTKDISKSFDIYELLLKYAPDQDLFSDEDRSTALLKDIIFHKLDETERRIIILYAELASLRKVAKVLGMSVCPIQKYISRLNKKITKLYYDHI